jgi:release factor glutamine methyltransferase
MADVWTISKLLGSLQGYLRGRGIEGPRLDAEVLISHVLKCDRIRLYTHFDQPVTEAERTTLRELARRRGQGEPIAYLTGVREFFSRDFAVNPNVLIPRPETEHVVECALAWYRHAQPQNLRICDVGTGSGAIGITLACEIPDAQVVLTDLSPEALAVAEGNAQALGVSERVTCVRANLLTPQEPAGAAAQALAKPFDIIVSNPPYIAEGEMAGLPRDVAGFEPHLALTAGAEGLDCLLALCAAVPKSLSASGFCAVEMGEGQGDAVRHAMAAILPHVAGIQDLAGIERVVAGWHDATFSLSASSPFMGQPSASGITAI